MAKVIRANRPSQLKSNFTLGEKSRILAACLTCCEDCLRLVMAGTRAEFCMDLNVIAWRGGDDAVNKQGDQENHQNNSRTGNSCAVKEIARWAVRRE